MSGSCNLFIDLSKVHPKLIDVLRWGKSSGYDAIIFDVRKGKLVANYN